MLSAIGATAIEEEPTQGHCPILTSLGVDLSNDFRVKSLLHAIVRLHKYVSSIELLSFEAANDRLTTLVQTPRLDTRNIAGSWLLTQNTLA
jgi:hypothetical protein